ncbi:MAG: hypothetical protein R3D46_05555 [Defluviimonas denitrificans]
MRAQALVLGGQPPDQWPAPSPGFWTAWPRRTARQRTDRAYHAARREVFATCPRIVVPNRPGEALLIHRLTLHGISPWAEGAKAPEDGRIVAYFRPVLGSVAAWMRP